MKLSMASSPVAYGKGRENKGFLQNIQQQRLAPLKRHWIEETAQPCT